jgi:hypothetical protein
MAAVRRFDTLSYANTLKEAGIDSKQAEIFAELQRKIIEDIDSSTVSTKKDISDLKDLIHANTWKIIGYTGSFIALLAALQTILQTIFHFFPK